MTRGFAIEVLFQFVKFFKEHTVPVVFSITSSQARKSSLSCGCNGGDRLHYGEGPPLYPDKLS